MRKVSIVKKEVNREEVQAWVQERFELSVTRIRGIAKEHAAASRLVIILTVRRPLFCM